MRQQRAGAPRGRLRRAAHRHHRTSVRISRTVNADRLVQTSTRRCDVLAFPLAHPEPSNALSLATWSVHVSSVAEWLLIMVAISKYASLTSGGRRNRRGGLDWLVVAMIPAQISALCACTFHFFYNDTEKLGFLLTTQAALTLGGNVALALAAREIVQEQEEQEASEDLSVGNEETINDANRIRAEKSLAVREAGPVTRVAFETVLSAVSIGVAGGAIIKYGSLLTNVTVHPSAPIALSIVLIPSAIVAAAIVYIGPRPALQEKR